MDVSSALVVKFEVPRLYFYEITVALGDVEGHRAKRSTQRAGGEGAGGTLECPPTRGVWGTAPRKFLKSRCNLKQI